MKKIHCQSRYIILFKRYKLLINAVFVWGKDKKVYSWNVLIVSMNNVSNLGLINRIAVRFAGKLYNDCLFQEYNLKTNIKFYILIYK